MMRQYMVDAFTDRLFSGNPAAVCVLETWPEENVMKNIARENNLSETAFVVRGERGYHLRWFTPTDEINLCGHATLATGFTILNYYDTGAERVEFDTMSGMLSVTRRDDRYEMDFPTYAQAEIAVTNTMTRAFGTRPEKALLGMDLVCVFDSEETIRNLKPNIKRVGGLPGRLQNVTAPGTTHDCVTRSFAPKCGIEEDPVCGSAHCQVAAYWSQVLGKPDIVAYQASERGGTLYCELMDNGRIKISGKATLFAISEIQL